MTRRRWIADRWTESSASLTGEQAAHLARVLRAQPGMIADVVANGQVFRATVAQVSMDEVVFTMHEMLQSQQALPVIVLMAVYKFDRMEWALEKVTELGVEAIVPVVTRRTEKHLAQSADKRVERWRRIAHEASQQSRRVDVPRIENPLTLPKYLHGASTSEASVARRIVLAETEHQRTLRMVLEADAAEPDGFAGVKLAIGPEGGWTAEEMALFDSSGWTRATLGTRILRAETAAITAVSIACAWLS